MKKLLAIILSVLLLAALSACTAEDAGNGEDLDSYKENVVEETQWTDNENENTFYFEAVDSESITITGFSTTNSTPHTVEIPAYMFDKCVVAIADNAFANVAEIGTLIFPEADDFEDGIPETFTIGKNAFRGCFAMEEIVIPAYVTSIGDKAFYGCEAATSLTFEEDGRLEAIAASTFQECSSLSEVVIPGSVKTIGDAAFFECTALTSVIMEEGVTTVGAQVFQNCAALETLEAPATLESVGKHTFAGCLSIKSVSIPTWIIPDFEKTNLESAVLIAGDSIPASAFKSCDLLASITLNDEIKEIGEYAFVGCRSLKALTIPKGVSEISTGTFKNCSALESIEIPAAVISIGASAFNGCDTISEVVIPASVISIGDEAFSSCDSLAKISVEENNTVFKAVEGNLYNSELTVLLQYAVASETVTFEIPETVKEIKPGAFESCVTLNTLVMHDTVEKIGKSAFTGCINLEDATVPMIAVTELDKTGLKYLTITFGTELPEEALLNAKLLEAVVLVDTVTAIGDGAFRGCENLNSLVIPDGVEAIGNHVFDGCKKMVSVAIPDSVTSIGDAAFFGCASLAGVAIPENVTVIGKEAFRGCATVPYVALPKGIESIGDFAFNECTSLQGFTLDAENEVYTVVNSDLYNKDVTVLIQYALGKANPYTPTYPESVTEIAENAFSGAMNLEEIRVPETIKTVGANAFAGCDNVRGAYVPTWALGKISTANLIYVSVIAGDTVGAKALAGSPVLDTVILHQGIKSVDPTAFEDCKSLRAASLSIDLISSLPKEQMALLEVLGDEIPEKAFYEWPALINVLLSDDCKKIGNGAFGKCASLVGISLGTALESIGDEAFAGCSSLMSIDFPDTLTTLGKNVFTQNYAMEEFWIDDTNTAFKTVDDVLYTKDGKILLAYPAGNDNYTFTIPEGVTEIAAGAFSGARKLVSITVSKDVATVGASAFAECAKLVEIKNLSSLNILAGPSNGGIAANALVNIYKEGDSKVTVENDFILYTTKDGDKDVVILMGYVGSSDTVTLPEEITSISAYAFTDSGVVTVIFDGTEEEWTKLTKAETWAFGLDAYTVKCSDKDIEFKIPEESEEK